MFGGLQKLLYFLLFYSSFVWTSTDGQRVILDPREDIYFSEDPPDPWREFLDAYYYQGPLQEDTFYSRPAVNYQGPLQDTFYSRPTVNNRDRYYPRPALNNRFVPEMDIFRPVMYPGYPNQRDDAYNRYRNYFYSRYGTNFLDSFF